ncbi:unnamed protein product [Parnassius apollo]|uniref:Carboxylic ester hydrolase n=1 Tax=Parnassius apollo TaxID=110799 RepID=A0A8S3WSE9_PARAO|nr:unnamed protein product [Parnassius apollo]
MCLSTIFCITFLLISCVISQDPTANLPQGRIVGIRVYTEASLTPVEIFYGIPYANAPIGKFRFSAPERHSGWRRTFFAHRMPPRCPQQDMDNENYNEDCLFLNIFAPRVASGWKITSCHVAARGNLALLDQYLALLWIRENIAAFGGDPNAITLVGHSAGADCVLNHIVSPRSIGLFHRAIVMSPRDIWRTVNKEISVNASQVDRVSRALAESLGCSSRIDSDILSCMRSRAISDIVSITLNETWLKDLQPVADNFLPDSEQYLPMSISEALTSPKTSNIQLDLLMGTTSLEAINYNDNIYEDLMKQGSRQVFEFAMTKAIPETLRMLSLQGQEFLPTLTQAIRWEFWGPSIRKEDEKNTLEAVEALARMETSAKWGAGGALLAARLARRVTHLYVYRFVQPSEVDMQGRHLNFSGAVHGADLIALLGDALMLQIARRPASDSEKRISSLFRKYIANFVKFGYPGINNEWQRYRPGDAYVQDILDEVNGNYKTLSTSRDVAFWLKYLPILSNLHNTKEHSEQITSENDENRLRGGMFAMSGVSIVLLLLLCVAAILLHRHRTRRQMQTFEIDVMNHH